MNERPLRLWPGVVAVGLQWLLRFGTPIVAPEAQLFALIAGLLGAAAIVVWWLFFSRARWSERLGAIVVMIVAIVAIRPLTHESIQDGMMGMMFAIYAIPPTLSLAFVSWAVVSPRLAKGPRRSAMVAAILIGCGVWTLVRTDGIHGGGSDLAWRWTPTAEDRLLAHAGDDPPSLPPPPTAAEIPEAAIAPEWPGFRGPERDGQVRGVRIETDWTASPPIEMWRRPIGPGWSSFAVSGDLLYTQEQRGDDEIVACYRVSTGEPVWRHTDPVRFWESNGGAGPRATPTVDRGRVYTLGATGIVNALDATTGSVVWSRNAASDTSIDVPTWGFAGSPLVIDDVVIVAVSGSLVGYDVSSGQPRWFGPAKGGSYSSPHRATIDGVEQILLLTTTGATSVAPADGELLWEHAWPGGAIVQPALTDDGEIVIHALAGAGGLGTRRLAITRGATVWSVEERWTSNGLKPYFNDFVIHEGHAFGFDGSILACIDLEDGKRKWKGGRYGSGQLILLADQDLLLVLSEDGELALVSATPDKFTEVARFEAIEGKSWSHPVLIGDILLLRNDQEMVAFRMTKP